MSRRVGRWIGGTINDQPVGFLAVKRHDRAMKRRGYRVAEKCSTWQLFGWRWHRHWPESGRESCERGQKFLAGG